MFHLEVLSVCTQKLVSHGQAVRKEVAGCSLLQSAFGPEEA